MFLAAESTKKNLNAPKKTTVVYKVWAKLHLRWSVGTEPWRVV